MHIDCLKRASILYPSLSHVLFNMSSHKYPSKGRVYLPIPWIWTFFVIFCSQFSSVQFSRSVVSDSATPWTAVRQASPSITNSRNPPCPLSRWCHLPSHPLSSPFPPALNLSQIRVFSNESALRIRWPKYWSFSFNISPTNEHSGLISFRMYWLDLLAVQGTLKSLLQHHSSKASILGCSVFFILHFSHPHMTTGKTIDLTRRTFVNKVMSLLFNMLSRLVMTFLPKSKRLLISWLQSPSAVILESPKIKSDTFSTVSPSTSHEVKGPDAMILVLWMWALSQLFHPRLPLSSRSSLVLLHFLP